jgi:hypothetical protein
MSDITAQLADALARDTIAAAEELGDENLIAEVSKVIGAFSTTTQEAFMTAIRVRISETRARKFLAEKLASAPRRDGPRMELGSRPLLDAADENAGGGH